MSLEKIGNADSGNSGINLFARSRWTTAISLGVVLLSTTGLGHGQQFIGSSVGHRALGDSESERFREWLLETAADWSMSVRFPPTANSNL